MDLNRAQLIGNVTKDPELRAIPSGQSVCNFSIATNMQWTDQQGQKQQKTEYHNIVAWGKLAEICSQYLAKGRKTYVEGRLQTREWEAQDGSKRRTTDIVAENVILLDRPPGAVSQRTSAMPTEPHLDPLPSPSDPPSLPSVSLGTQEIRMEDIPF